MSARAIASQGQASAVAYHVYERWMCGRKWTIATGCCMIDETLFVIMTAESSTDGRVLVWDEGDPTQIDELSSKLYQELGVSIGKLIHHPVRLIEASTDGGLGAV